MTYHRSSLGIAPLEARRRAVEFADPAVRDMAQGLVDQGNTAFRAGDFTTANLRYDEAFILLPTADMLLIIGLTMQRLARYRDASYRYLRYLRENPDGNRREMAQTGLAQVQVAMEREAEHGGSEMVFTVDEATAPAPAGPAPAPPPELRPDVLAAQRAVIQSARQVQERAPLPTSIRNPYAPPPYGIWIATGVGVVGLIGLGWWLTRKKKAPKKNRRRR